MATKYSSGFNATQRAFVGGLINPSNRALNDLTASICGENEATARDPDSQSARFAQLVRFVLVSAEYKAGDNEALTAILREGFDQLPEASFAKTGLDRSDATRATYTQICTRLMEQVQAMRQAPRKRVRAMTDAKDTRDKPSRKRARVDAHTDWMQERVTTEHKAWLEGNGRLAAHHFTSGWSVYAPDIAAPETAVLQDIASAYNAKMLQAMIVGKSTYRTLFKEMQAYEASFSDGLREKHPSLTQAQVDGITATCDMFRRDWVQKSFKASFELAAIGKKSGSYR